jgi:hypothetical protein
MVEGLKDIEQGRKEEESTLEAAGGGGRPLGPSGLRVALRARQDDEARNDPVNDYHVTRPLSLSLSLSLSFSLSLSSILSLFLSLSLSLSQAFSSQ